MNGWQAAAAVLCVITGTVYDGQHHPVPAVKVYLQTADKREMTVQTDSSGVYRFSVPAGLYKVHAEGEAAVTVTPGKTGITDLTVQPAFFDEPKFTAAGVTDYTYQGGHGSGANFRSAETLAKETAALGGSGDSNEDEIFTRGTELLNHRAPQAAAEVFTKGVGLFPQSLRMLLGLASACYSEGDYEEAARWFYKATDLSPRDPKPYLFLGKVQAKQITEADGYRQRMERFVKLQPENAMANYYYGTTLPDDKAQGLFEKAVKLDPKLGMGYVRLGIIEARKERFVEAVREYKRAIAVEPDLGEAHYRLSEVYRVTGEMGKAKEEMGVFERLGK